VYKIAQNGLGTKPCFFKILEVITNFLETPKLESSAETPNWN
jgi:hypothetical protein